MSAPSPPELRDYVAPNPPAALAAFDGAVEGLGVGSPGKVGVLDLAFEPIAGATRIVRHYQRLPLYCFHPLYVDPKWPSMAFVYALQGGEGIVQGDRYRVDLACAPGSAVHVTTQAATKVFGMAAGYASQIVNLTVGAGAFVEYLPDPIVPFRGSRFHQHTKITVEPGATAIFGETLLPGRVASGEAHAYAFFCSDTEVRSPDGTLLVADRLELSPASRSIRSLALLGPHEVLATLFVITSHEGAGTLIDRLRGIIREHAAVAGASALPNGSGVVVRALGSTSSEVTRLVRCMWNEARLAIAGVPAPDLRKT